MIIEKAEPLLVGDIFKDFYLVPDFQREFVWKKRQVQKLLADTYLAWRSGNNENYFLGSIVVFRSDDGALELVDGQQRMATLYMLFAAIRDSIKEVAPQEQTSVLDGLIAAPYTTEEGEDDHRHRVQLQYEESNIVLREIGDGPPPNAKDDEEDDEDFLQVAPDSPGYGLAVAYDECRAFLDTQFGEDDEASLRKFGAYLQLHCELIRVVSGDFQSALTIFEILNYGGVVLNAMDLLKNLMFRYTDSSSHRELVRGWDALLSTLRKGGETNRIRFLRYFLVSTYSFDRMPKAGEVFQWILEHPRELGYDRDPFDFIEEMQKAADVYVAFLEGMNPQGSTSFALKGIVYQKTRVRQHLPILLAARHLSGEAFEEIARSIEALTLVYALTEGQWNDIEQLAPKWGKKLRRVRNVDQARTFVAREVRPNIAALAATAREALKDTSGVSSGLVRYVLARMTHAIETSCGKDDDFDRYFKGVVTLEHVLPQKPTKEAAAAFSSKSKVVGSHIYRLGNLCLLYRGPNSIARNKPYKDKVEVYKRSDYELTKSLAQSIVMGGATNKYTKTSVKYSLKPFSAWGPKSVNSREEMLFKIGWDIWGF